MSTTDTSAVSQCKTFDLQMIELRHEWDQPAWGVLQCLADCLRDQGLHPVRIHSVSTSAPDGHDECLTTMIYSTPAPEPE